MDAHCACETDGVWNEQQTPVALPPRPPLPSTAAVISGRPDDGLHRGWQAWHALRGKRVLNEAVVLRGLGDIHPYHPSPVFDATTLFVEAGVDKNFVYYWVRPHVFPRLQTLYLGASPCEGVPMTAWEQGAVSLFLAKRHQGVWGSCAPILDPLPTPAHEEALRTKDLTRDVPADHEAAWTMMGHLYTQSQCQQPSRAKCTSKSWWAALRCRS